MADKNFYWLKLKNDFFKRHDIQIVEGMPNGKDYILFYLKLLLESVSHNGELRFSDTIPYNENMLATITNTNIDIVRNAMKIFVELKMVELLENQTIYMNEVSKMLGGETKWAEKKRIQREPCEDIVPLLSSPCPPNVRQEIEIELELDKDIEIEGGTHENSCSAPTNPTKKQYGEFKRVRLSDAEYQKLAERLSKSSADNYITKLDNYIESKGTRYKSHYATILNWARKDDENKPAPDKTSYDIGEIDEFWNKVPKL